MNDNKHNVSHWRGPVWLKPAPSSAAVRMRAAGHSPRLQALNLLWSFWIFLGPVFSHANHGLWFSIVLSYPLFLLIFLLSYVRPSEESHTYVCAMALLAAASLPWNPAAWTYAVFACAMVPYEGSLFSSVSKVMVIQALLVLEGIYLQWPWFAFVILVGVCTSTGIGALMGRISWDKTIKLRMSDDQIRQLAATAERERIGRDLHDLLGHTLSLITLKLELSRKLFDRDPATARRELGEAEEVARHALAEVRAAVTGIRAAGLAAELASAALLLRTSGVQFEQQLQVTNLPEQVECALALVLREAMTNIARHAHATRASATLTVIDGHLQLCIQDNGCGGIDVYGNGLHGIIERVHALGGHVRVESPRGEGTLLDISLPLSSPKKVPSIAATAAGESQAITTWMPHTT